jgi:hypothetical protein
VSVRARTVLSGVVCIATAFALGAGVPGAAGAADRSRPASAPARTAPVHMPAQPAGLPAPGPTGAAIDPAAAYQPQLACVTAPSRGISALRALALSTYGRGGDSSAAPRACTSGGTSEHKDGRAWDWMLAYGNLADRRVARDFLGWLTGDGPSGRPGEMADRLGVMYLIYNKMMWSSYDRRWHAYTGSDPHTSHIHISLSWNGARAHTSFWTGRVWATDYGPCQVFSGQPAITPGSRARVVPCPDPQPLIRSSPQPLAWLGSSGSYVAQAQRLLGISEDGVFASSTRHAVLAYQRAAELPPTGAVDEPTWASLLPGSSSLHQPAWQPARAAAWARRAGSPVVRSHEAGAFAFALQAALGISGRQRTGYFGAQTRAAVLAFKSAHDLGRTALVTAAVWKLLPAG